MDPMAEGAMWTIIQEAQRQGFQVWWHAEAQGWRFVSPKGDAYWFYPRNLLDVVHVLTVLISIGLDW